MHHKAAEIVLTLAQCLDLIPSPTSTNVPQGKSLWAVNSSFPEQCLCLCHLKERHARGTQQTHPTALLVFFIYLPFNISTAPQ